MKLVSSGSELQTFCLEAAELAEYVAIDTEFIRQNTYYAKVCLIQLAFKSPKGKKLLLFDPLAKEVDLVPLQELLRNQNVLKIMHAGRQDLEIFLNLFDFLPVPLFDTQVAAMVCGMGEQEGYESLVRNLLGKQINKECQFTNWSKRPLSNEQITYAAEDVTYLCEVFEILRDKLDELDRTDWVIEEINKLTDRKTYDVSETNSLKRIKGVNGSTHFKLSVAKLVNFREKLAQELNLPRNHVIKDSNLLKLAKKLPQTIASLEELNIFSSKIKADFFQKKLIKICQTLKVKDSQTHVLQKNLGLDENILAIVNLLKSLLKIKSNELNLPPKLIATLKDLEIIASEEEPDVMALKGWRNEIFGLDALRLKRGEIALTISEDKILQVNLKDYKL